MGCDGTTQVCNKNQLNGCFKALTGFVCDVVLLFFPLYTDTESHTLDFTGVLNLSGTMRYKFTCNFKTVSHWL